MKKNSKTTSKIPKIKIPPQDLQSFLMEHLVIDPFWYDLYGIKNESVSKSNTN